MKKLEKLINKQREVQQAVNEELVNEITMLLTNFNKSHAQQLLGLLATLDVPSVFTPMVEQIVKMLNEDQ